MESIHQARIALRRIRAALQVLDESDSDEIKLCRDLGRALGRTGASRCRPSSSDGPRRRGTSCREGLVDQMRGEYVDKFQRPGTGGLHRLLADGAWFRQLEGAAGSAANIRVSRLTDELRAQSGRCDASP